MSSREDLQFRLASYSDAGAIAALHADSWRRHYRGAYSDVFLDGDVHTDRAAVWTERLREPDPRHRTIVADDNGGRLVGFAHTIFDDDPTWGALLDNLHVAYRHQRRGVGTALLASSVPAVIERGTGLYLWVLEQNIRAQAFYEALGARRIERALVSPPGGIASRINGSPAMLRYAWTDPSLLVASASESARRTPRRSRPRP